jgi:hypothetical protein
MSISISGYGSQDNILAQVDPTMAAFRVNVRPTEHVINGQIGGHFYMACNFSNSAGGPVANSELFTLRWADTTKLLILKRVLLTVNLTTVFTNAQLLDYDIIKATAYSTAATGGTAITLPTNSNKARSSNMNGSLLGTTGNIMVTSGTALTAGTKTFDTQPFGYGIALAQNAAAASATQNLASCVIPLYEVRDFGQHPMVFSNNEGFSVRNVTALGAAGVAKHGLILEWMEASAY